MSKCNNKKMFVHKKVTKQKQVTWIQLVMKEDKVKKIKKGEEIKSNIKRVKK